MKTIGLIGGMSWESTETYYRLINERVNERLGGYHSAQIAMASVDFHDYEDRLRAGDWKTIASALSAVAATLERVGAECVLLCTNTMHRVAEDIERAITVPFLHIADAVGKAAQSSGIDRVGLLGTAFTMEEPFYRNRLQERFDIAVVTPDADERAAVHRIIFDELVHGRILDKSRETYRSAISALIQQGAQAVVLGCTEIGMLVSQADSPVPVFDTTVVHAAAAVSFALD